MHIGFVVSCFIRLLSGPYNFLEDFSVEQILGHRLKSDSNRGLYQNGAKTLDLIQSLN
jgi:hypothetical protein